MKNFTFVLFAFVAFLFSSCKGDPSKIQVDNVLDIAMLKEPSRLNPITYYGSVERNVFHHLFLPMADFDPNTYELSPILIKAIPQAVTVVEGPYKGGTSYTIEIKDEATWDDGSPVTAKDVLFTIKAIKHPNVNAAGHKSYLKRVTDFVVDADNPKRGTFYFDEYYILAKEVAVTLEVYPQYHYDPGYAPDLVTIPELDGENAEKIVSDNAKLGAFAEEFNGVKFARESISGAGPYRFKKWISNQVIEIEKKWSRAGANSTIPSR